MPARAPLVSTRLLREHVRALFARLPGAISGVSSAVHQLRVSGRRLRLALGLLARRPHAARVRRARRGLQELVRAAAFGRDLDVMLALLEKHLRTAARLEAWQRNLLRRLRAAQRRSRHQLAEAVLDLDLARLRRRLRELVARGGGELGACLEHLRVEAERERAKLAGLLAELHDAFEPERLHVARTGFRRLRYAAELSEALLGHTQAESALLRAQQQQLGQVHDAWILACWLRTQSQRDAARGQAAPAAEAARLGDALELQARGLHADWWQGQPSLLVERLRLAWPVAAQAPGSLEE